MTKETLQLIFQTAEDALAVVPKLEGAINYGELHCVDVSYCINQDGEDEIVITIEEAAPENPTLQKYVHDYLLAQSKVAIPCPVEVRTEW